MDENPVPIRIREAESPGEMPKNGLRIPKDPCIHLSNACTNGGGFADFLDCCALEAQ